MNRRRFLVSCGLAGCLPWAARAAEGAAARPPNAMPSNARITCEKIHLKLTHTWAIARGAADFKENVIVRYERDGLTGYGEAGHLTAAGQTAEQTMRGVERLIPLYTTVDPFAWAGLPERARAVPEVTSPARAAVELALMDWVGKSLGLPLHRLFGLDGTREVPTSFSIGLDTPDVMRQKVREASAYRLIKVKLGREDDEEIIRTLRSVTDKPIRVDANEGWRDKEQALRRIEWLATQQVELVEQPMPRTMLEETRWVRERTGMPLIADEAVAIADDIPALAGAYTGVNIKLMKAGGVVEALRMFQVARAHGLDAMLGCMIETSVAITAAVQLQSLARWVDLDGSLLLQRDPFVGATFQDGAWRVPDRPGLGVEPAAA